VRVELPGNQWVEGTATGVDETGRLLVDTDSGARAFGAGDVMHVRRRA
jgi:BirA family biotin operon repressor/biotin-[acetyl-CoA-carboxylase] ligase